MLAAALMVAGVLIATAPAGCSAREVAARGDLGRAPAPRVSRRRVGPAVLSVGAGLAPLLVVSGPLGWLLAPIAGWGGWKLLTSGETTLVKRRREAITRDLPHAVDLLASTLRAGAAPTAAVGVVSQACDGPVAEQLGLLQRQLAMSDDPARTWRDLARQDVWAPLGDAMVRAETTGASVADAVELLAAELERSALADVEDRARTVGVRAAIPLGACLLPSFVLLGIVPTVAGLLASITP